VVVKDVIYGVAGEMQQARIYMDPAPSSSYCGRIGLQHAVPGDARDRRGRGVQRFDHGAGLAVQLHGGAEQRRITQRTDAVSGEQVSYTYDTLNRLITAVTTVHSMG